MTPRERQVFEQVVEGRLNKQIAADLGTTEKTVKVHRARMMQKIGVRSLAELVRLAAVVGGAVSGSAPQFAVRALSHRTGQSWSAMHPEHPQVSL